MPLIRSNVSSTIARNALALNLTTEFRLTGPFGNIGTFWMEAFCVEYECMCLTSILFTVFICVCQSEYVLPLFWFSLLLMTFCKRTCCVHSGVRVCVCVCVAFCCKS